MRAKTAQVERYIRDAAVKRGIDPNVAVRVAKSEGLKPGVWQSNVTKRGRREKSYGPFQLNIEKGRLGVQFTKATGLDPRDQSTVFSQIDFALDHAAKHGWGAWYGAANVGIARRQGLSKARPIGVQAAAAAPDNVAASQAVAPTPAVSFGLGAFLGDPLGLSAYAAEAPQQGLGAVAALEGLAAPNMETGVSPARIGAMFDRAAVPQGLGPVTPSPERFGTPQISVSSPVTPAEGYAAATAPSSVPARAAFDAVAQSFGAPDLSTPASNLGAIAGSMVGPAPAEQGPMSPDGRVADPFGNYVDKGPLGTVQKAETARMPGAALAYGEEAAPTQGLGTQAPTAPNAPNGLGAYTPSLASPGPRGAFVAGPYEQDAATAIAYGDENTIPDEESFPDAPPEPSRLQGLLSTLGPNTKRGLLGLALGGPIGGLLGAASGMMSGGLGALGPAGMAGAGERYSAGTGLGGIAQGMYGPRGATGYSRSNPNTSVTSRGPNQGYDMTNQYGARTTYGPAGDIRGNKDTNWGGVLGGIFGGSKSKDKDKDKDGKGGRGLGGYSGAGLY